jgi:hypothetical protein
MAHRSDPRIPNRNAETNNKRTDMREVFGYRKA